MLPLLEGITVLDLSSIVMGPMAAQTLGDYGATVIKVEPPEGDLARASGTPGPDGTGALFANNNRNKRSIVLDLKSDRGRAVLDRLLQRADILLHNMRPRAAERLGISAARLMALRPDLIHCAAVGFGSDGPFADRPAYDDIVQAAAGLASLPGEFGEQPAFVASIVADKVAGLKAVQAILAALMYRERTGRGCAIEVPMFECLVAFLFNEHLDAATFGGDAAPGYARLLNPHRKPYATADGWLAVMPYSEKDWRRLLVEFGRSDVLEAEWFASAAGRNGNSARLYQVLAEGLKSRSTADWAECLDRLDIPYSEVNSLESLLEHPHLKAKDFFRPVDGFEGRVRSVPEPVCFSLGETSANRAAPLKGADTREILAEFGLTEEEIDDLVEA